MWHISVNNQCQQQLSLDQCLSWCCFGLPSSPTIELSDNALVISNDCLMKWADPRKTCPPLHLVLVLATGNVLVHWNAQQPQLHVSFSAGIQSFEHPEVSCQLCTCIFAFCSQLGTTIFRVSCAVSLALALPPPNQVCL